MNDSSKLPTYTLEEVRRHNTRKDLWIVIERMIYDVTPYLREHPGGWEVFVDNAG